MKKVTILLTGLGLLLVFSQQLAAKGPPAGGGSIPGHISINVQGAVLAKQDCDANLGADDTSYLCNKGGTFHKIDLKDFFLKDENQAPRVYPNGASASNCFGAAHFNVTIGVMLNKDLSAETVLRFWAYKDDAETEILYVLWVKDPSGWSDDFPPQPGDSIIMGDSNGVSWNLVTSKRNESEGACVDSGTFTNPDFIKVIFTRDS